jgi:WD40 repeat protein
MHRRSEISVSQRARGASVHLILAAFLCSGCAAKTAMSLVRAPVWQVVPAMDTFLLTARATRDARRVVVISQDGDVAIWQSRPRRQIARLQIPGTHPLHAGTGRAQIALDPSGELLAVGGDDGRVHVWRLEPFELVLADTPTPPGTTRQAPDGQSMRYMGTHPASAVALSADAHTLAVNAGHLVMFWDLRSGRRRDSLWIPAESGATPSTIQRLAFSPSDGSLLIGATDGWLYGVDPLRLQIEWKINLGLGQLRLLTVDPSGYQIAIAGSNDSTVRLINAATRQEACRFDVPFAESAAFSMTGHALVVGSGRSSVYVFDARECQLLAHYREFAGSVTGVWFGPDCRSVIVALNVSPVLYERRASIASC